MTTLDPLTEPLVRLFLRIDAAYPSDGTLKHIADYWQNKRGGRLAPGESEMAAMPEELLVHAFVVRLTSNGTQHWLVSKAGATAVAILNIGDGEIVGATGKRNAVRLRRLFELVAERAEPYSAMFESNEPGQPRRLIEVFAAPLGGAEKASHLIFVAASSRAENR